MSEGGHDDSKVIRLRTSGMHNSDRLTFKDVPAGEVVAPLAPKVTYNGPSDHWAVEIPAAELEALIAPFEGRKRAYLVALLNGKSKRMAAANVGVSDRQIRNWAQADPPFGQAASVLYDIGFSTVLESELYRRAMAGSDDRGSMRALELIIKSRDPEYREKSSIEFSVARAAHERMNDLVADYKPAEIRNGPS